METKPTPAEFLEKKYNGTIPELWMRQGFTTAAHVMENMRDYSADLLAKVQKLEEEVESIMKRRNKAYAELDQERAKVSEQSQRIQQLEEALREALPIVKESISEYERLMNNEKHSDALWAMDQVKQQQEQVLEKIEALLNQSGT